METTTSAHGKLILSKKRELSTWDDSFRKTMLGIQPVHHNYVESPCGMSTEVFNLKFTASFYALMLVCICGAILAAGQSSIELVDYEKT